MSNLLVKVNFTESTAEAEKAMRKIKDKHFIRLQQHMVQPGRDDMSHEVGVRAKCVLRTVLPCLHSFAKQ